MEGSDLVSLGDGKGWPPGFRFHPTDEELVVYYLKRKICRRKLKPDVIGETDVYKWDPEELPGVSRLKSRDRQWYFFSPRDRKYPNGARSNRATRQGYWKATGKDRIITCNSRSVGLKKTLVFYEGRAPSGKRTDWVMHEYTMDEEELQRCQTVKEYFALYKVYKKSGPGPKNGEQYGAPFREEEWLDDDDEEEEAECSKARQKFDNTCSKDQNTSITQRNLLLDDFDDLLKNGVNNTLLEELSNEIPFPEQVDADRQEIGFPDANQQCFDYTQLTNNLNEYSDLTNTVTDIDQFQMAQEDPLEDYLEMNDLDASDPGGGEIDGLSILDLYHDAAMFIQDMGPENSGMVFSSITDQVDGEYVQQASSQPCLNDMNNEVANPNTHLLASNLDSAEWRNFFSLHSQPSLNDMNNEVANPNAHLLASNLDNAEWGNIYSLSTNQLNDYEPIEDQIWVHNQNLNIEETIIQQPPVSGVIYDENQNQNQNQNIERGNSWFSSAVWNFVDSIPSSPASAAESSSVMVTKRFERISSLTRLTSKRFERLSSFSRLTAKTRTNPDNENENENGNNNKKGKFRSRYNSWGMYYYCFSLIGVIIAILCLSKNLLGSCLPFLS